MLLEIPGRISIIYQMVESTHHSRPFQCGPFPTFRTLPSPSLSFLLLASRPANLPARRASRYNLNTCSPAQPSCATPDTSGEMSILSSSAVTKAKAALLLSDIESHPLCFLRHFILSLASSFSLVPFCKSKNAHSLILTKPLNTHVPLQLPVFMATCNSLPSIYASTHYNLLPIFPFPLPWFLQTIFCLNLQT